MRRSKPKASTEPASKAQDIPGIDEEVVRAISGITAEDARAAIEYPGAAAEIERLYGAEKTSVRVGDPAPDFFLPRLTGPDVGERVTLSDNFGTRPVALVFGSYT